MEKPAVLTDLLTCTICLDVLDNTMVTKNCLHRFCADCITTALRRGNQECPNCRKKLVSRRCLRPDPNFDSLINRLFPGRKEAMEKENEKMLSLVNKHSENLHKTAKAKGILDGESESEQPVKKSRGRKRKSQANTEKQNLEELGSDDEKEIKKSGKGVGRKKKIQKNDVKISDDEPEEPNTPLEPMKKRKRKTKKQLTTPTISTNNSELENDSDTESKPTISKPPTPKFKKKSPKSVILSELENEVSSDDSTESEASSDSTDFHFSLKKLDEVDDVVATEVLSTSSKATVEH